MALFFFTRSILLYEGSFIPRIFIHSFVPESRLGAVRLVVWQARVDQTDVLAIVFIFLSGLNGSEAVVAGQQVHREEAEVGRRMEFLLKGKSLAKGGMVV